MIFHLNENPLQQPLVGLNERQLLLLPFIVQVQLAAVAVPNPNASPVPPFPPHSTVERCIFMFISAKIVSYVYRVYWRTKIIHFVRFI